MNLTSGSVSPRGLWRIKVSCVAGLTPRWYARIEWLQTCAEFKEKNKIKTPVEVRTRRRRKSPSVHRWELWSGRVRQQLLRPGTCSRTWLAFGYVLIRPSRGHKHMQQVLSECTQRPKGQLCAPSVSKRIRISGGAGSCLGSGASPWVIRRGCQGRVRRSGGGAEKSELLLPLPPPSPPLLLSHSTQTHPHHTEKS